MLSSDLTYVHPTGEYRYAINYLEPLRNAPFALQLLLYVLLRYCNDYCETAKASF